MREHRITTFGLTEEQNALVKDSIPAKDYEVFDTDAFTDLIAIGHVALILNADMLSDDEREMLCGFYEDVGSCSDETLIWLGECKPLGEAKRVFKYYRSFSDIEEKLKYLLLEAHRKSKKAAEYSERLANGFLIISLIKKNPGIKTREIAERMELNVRTVQRYISALQAAGEWIEYDRSKRGWELLDGISVLSGELWDGEK